MNVTSVKETNLRNIEFWLAVSETAYLPELVTGVCLPTIRRSPQPRRMVLRLANADSDLS